MTGHDAADQPRLELFQEPHHSESCHAHRFEIGKPLIAFMDPCKDLNLVPNLAIRGEIGGAMIEIDAQPGGGLSLGRKVLGLHALIHEPGGFDGNLPPQFGGVHGYVRPILEGRLAGAGLPQPGSSTCLGQLDCVSDYDKRINVRSSMGILRVVGGPGVQHGLLGSGVGTSVVVGDLPQDGRVVAD